MAYLQQEDEAGKLLEQAADKSPGSAQAQLYLGRMLLDGDDAQAAIEALVQAKLNDPRSWRAYAWLAEAYTLDGQVDLAEQQLRDALESRLG